mgnify:CR=1 FL=1
MHLDQGGIEYYGTQYGLGDESVLIKEIGNKKVGFIGINDTNYPLDSSKVVGLIKNIENKADHIIVNIHWGQEYELEAHARQKFLAYEMVDAGADVIIGHHPHVIQEVEVYKNKPIFYSLGNFVFDQYFSKETQEGLAVGVVLKQDEILLYLFPLISEKSMVRHMGFGKVRILFDRVTKKVDNENKDDKILKIHIK